MAKYNTPAGARTAKPPVAKAPVGVIGTKKSGKPAKTFEGHDGFERKDKSALFLLAAGSLNNEDKFYESGKDSTTRLVDLVRKVAVKDPEWIAAFLRWLRSEGNIRTASVVGGVEAADALAKAGVPGGRQILASVLQRADEPGEAMAYWLATRGRKVLMPKPVKRGIADAAVRLYTEFSFLKYDSDRAAVRFGDVIEMVRPEPKKRLSVTKTISDLADERGIDLTLVEADLRRVASGIREKLGEDTYISLGTVEFVRKHLPLLTPGWRTRTVSKSLGMGEADLIEALRPTLVSRSWQEDLFRYAIEKRHNRGSRPSESLEMVRRQAEWFRNAQAVPLPIDGLLDTEHLRGAGLTWEDAMSALGSKVDKAKIWKAILPNLNYMALIRNLRNLDEAKVPDKDVAAAIARIQDPEQVVKSRQLPYRFYSAYKNAPSLRWGHALEVALGLSLQNIPTLGGRTLILIDTSGSMSSTMSEKSQMTYQEAAGLFGIALGMKGDGEADVYGWADSPFHFPMAKGASVLKNLERYAAMNGKTGHGTNLDAAISGTYVPGKYDRMVVISDMQVMAYRRGVLPTDIPCYFFNLGGYAPAAVQTTGKIYELGGLTDHTFKMITMLEAGDSGKWPWETSPEDELLEKMGRPETVVSTDLV